MKRSIAGSAPYVAFVLSGLSSLIFQTIWTRMLHHVFGATSVAISTVLTVFMAGLGLGAYFGGRYARKIKHPIFAYACLEVGVAVWGLVIPYLVASDGWLAGVNAYLHQTFETNSLWLMVVRFLCMVPILLLPTTMMGMSLPLLAQHFVQRERDPQRASVVVGALYGFNTSGAALGPFLSAFILMPTVGLAATNLFACSLNLALAILIFASRRALIGSGWSSGEKLSIFPSSEAVEAEPNKADDSSASHIESPKSSADSGDAEALWVPPSARALALFAFGFSGAASLCYEVVWSRALAMTIGSSIYSFSLILDTFLIGIATGSFAMSAAMSRGRSPTPTMAALASLLAAAPFGLDMRTSAGNTHHEGSLFVWVLVSLAPLFWIALSGVVGHARAERDELMRSSSASGRKTETSLGAQLTLVGVVIALLTLGYLASSAMLVGAGLVLGTTFVAHRGFTSKLALPPAINESMLLAPVLTAGITLWYFRWGYLPKIIATVVVLVCAFSALVYWLRRFPVLLLALVQFFIAIATTASYYWQDEIPFAFAQLVTSIDSLPDHVGTVQFFMFLTAALCTFPATLGMGAMFPLTMRIWTAGGRRIAEDVGIVYTANTVGSIIGSWLPGFLLMPMIGMERTLQLGIALNLVLALVMLIAGAADEPTASSKKAAGDKKATREIPVWHATIVYILAPLIPALLALLYLGTASQPNPDNPLNLRWNTTQMTLGVFRVSLAEGILDQESWGSPEIRYYRDGLSTTVSVEQWGRHFALKNNGKVDASNGDDMPTQITVAAYPLLMHPHGPDGLDVAVVGFGSGVTVGTALSFPVARVDVLELERFIPDAARFFEDVNLLDYNLDDFPFVQMDRLQIINDDGRNYLASTGQQYDVIISEPSNPWITGVSDLFTVDHFQIAKRALRPNGIYCQWVQLYELSPENIKSIYRTFAEQYEYVMVFSADDRSSDTVMLGSDTPLELNLERLRDMWRLPPVSSERSTPPHADEMSVGEQLERAELQTPFDMYARILLADKDEVLRYSQIERRLRGGEWHEDLASSNGGTCTPPSCERRAVELNTDDNARIEFAAPRDLIGFERYEGYLSSIYSPDWPYAQLDGHLDGFGEGDARAQDLAELAMALVAHGRYESAAHFVESAQEAGHAVEVAVALEVLTHLLTNDHEPAARIEPPMPGPGLDRRSAEQLLQGFDLVRGAIDRNQWGTALTAMENIPAPLRLHSGPAMRFLYGYLLYKASSGTIAQYRAATEQFDELARSSTDYVARHPEVNYFLARSRDGEGDYAGATRAMRDYIEARVIRPLEDELREPADGLAPTTDAAGESNKIEHRRQL